MRLAIPVLLSSAALVYATSVAPAAKPDAAVYEDLAVDLLRRYLQIDTTNPPGNELKAALFYKEILEREGIPVEVEGVTNSPFPENLGAIGDTRVMVPPDRAEEARALIAEREKDAERNLAEDDEA